jgi:hypothetical protein
MQLGRSGARPDAPDDATGELEGDNEELEQLVEDHARARCALA